MKFLLLKTIILSFIFIQMSFSKDISLTNEEKIFLKNKSTIILGSDSKWEPYIIKQKDGSISGFDKDLLDLINKKTGANFQLEVGTVNKMHKKVFQKKIDGLSTTSINKKRAEYLNFSNSYFSFSKGLIIASNNPKKINSINDLVGMKIGYQKGSLFNKKILSRYKKSILVPLDSLKDVIDSLILGQIDATIAGNSIYFAYKDKSAYMKTVDFFPDSELKIVFAVRKEFPLAISILNKGLDAILPTEKLALINKWFYSHYEIKKTRNVDFNQEEKNFINNSAPIKVALAKDYKPFSYKEDQVPRGLDFDILDLIEKKSGLKFEKIQNTWSESLSNFRNNKVDLITGFTYTKEREKTTLFSPSYYESNLKFTLLVRKNLKTNKNLTWSENFKKHKIGIVKDVFFKNIIEKMGDFEIIEFNDKSNLLDSLNSSSIDVAIYDLFETNMILNKKLYENIIYYDDIEIPDIRRNDIRIGIQKDEIVLHDILKKTMKSISNEEFHQLKSKWFSTQSDNTLTFSNDEINYLKNKKEIKICVDPNWLPFESISNSGKYKGIGSDLIKIITKKLDKPFVLIPTKTWSESLANINNRSCDILPVAMNVESRQNTMNFTKAYTKEPFVIATKFDKLFIKDSLELADKKIGIVYSYAFSEVLKKKHKNINIVNVKNAKDGLERVRNGELFGYVDIVPAIVYTMQKYSMVDLKISGKLEFYIELSIASRNDEPELNKILEKTLATINEDKIRSIIGKWLSIKIEQKVDYTLLWQISFVFLLIIIIILYKNREVRKLNSKLLSASIEIKEQQFMVDKYVMIVTTDLKGKIVDVNEAFCKKIGYKKTDLIGQSHKMMRHPNMTKKYFNDLWLTIKNNKTWSGEIQNLTKDNRNIYFNTVIEPLYKDMKKIGYRSISEDITDKKRIEELSITDKLTGLYNRLKIDEVLNNQIEYSKRYKVSFCVILIDIDNFKMINDTYGHDKGDYVLSEISTILKQNIRKTDSVGRWGGEEFFILCPNTDKEDCFLIAESIRKNVESHSFWDISKLTISLGLTSFLDNDNSLTIFKRVDNALYKAKDNGKNQTTVI